MGGAPPLASIGAVGGIGVDEKTALLIEPNGQVAIVRTSIPTCLPLLKHTRTHTHTHAHTHTQREREREREGERERPGSRRRRRDSSRSSIY